MAGIINGLQTLSGPGTLTGWKKRNDLSACEAPDNVNNKFSNAVRSKDADRLKKVRRPVSV
jgi:hypothetical protein